MQWHFQKCLNAIVAAIHAYKTITPRKLRGVCINLIHITKLNK